MNKKAILNAAVLISALGYFVDIYDLLLFSIVRVASLKDLNVPAEQIFHSSVFLINSQMAGMLIGGILWGILGDKRGRVSVLFGSIFLYSISNIANAYVHSVEAYAIWRFLAGLGLAGELGAAITLVCEVMDQKTRGYGTAIVASVGILGAIVAAVVGEYFNWRTSFIIGGIMGLALLILRFRMLESGLYQQMSSSKIARGNLWLIFRSGKNIWKYLCSVMVGMPLWFVVGILVTFSPELSVEAGVVGGPAVAGRAVIFSYLGLSIGDLICGFLSQYLGSRKKVVFGSLIAMSIAFTFYIFWHGLSLVAFYWLCGILGLATGFWAIFVTMAAEQFGTNLRATVTTTAPNFVRGAVVPVTMAFQSLQLHFSKLHSAFIVGSIIIVLTALALTQLEETHGKNLDYLEE